MLANEDAARHFADASRWTDITPAFTARHTALPFGTYAADP